jgi:hypothetical protein
VCARRYTTLSSKRSIEASDNVSGWWVCALGRTGRPFVQLKVTSSGSEVRIRSGAARPSGNAGKRWRWWGRWRALPAGSRATALPSAAARELRASAGAAPSAGSRELCSALSPGIDGAGPSAGPVDRGDHEVPLIVASLPFVDTDRGLLALAVDAHDPATHGAGGGIEAAGTSARHVPYPAGRLGRRRAAAARRLRNRASATALAGTQATAGPDPRSGSGSRPGTLTWDGGLCSDPDHVEIFLSDRIEVLLAKEPALDQDVDARRERVRVLCAVQGYRTRVLLAAEYQLRFLLALGGVAPRRERDAHEDGHHGEADKQRRHGVTPFSTFKIRESLTL